MLETVALRAFILKCQKEGMPADMILQQILKFCWGERGIELHDNCIILVDGYWKEK